MAESSSGDASGSGEGGGDQYLVHKVSKTDNMAGIAIRYGVTVLDLKQANGLLSDNAMFARDTLLVPLERREARVTDASTVAKFVNHLGRRVDHTDFVSRPGTTALGAIACGPRSLEDSVTTPTSTAASSESGSHDLSWRDPAEAEMKMHSDIAMPSKKQNGYSQRESMRQRTLSSRNSERPASCSPSMEGQADREGGSLWTGERPCSPSRSEICPGTTSSAAGQNGQTARRSRPPNLPNGKKASQITDYLASMAQWVGGSSPLSTPRDGPDGTSTETLFQRIRRVANESALGTGSIMDLTSFGDPLASSIAAMRSRVAANGRTPPEGGSTHAGAAIPKNGLKSD